MNWLSEMSFTVNDAEYAKELAKQDAAYYDDDIKKDEELNLLEEIDIAEQFSEFYFD